MGFSLSNMFDPAGMFSGDKGDIFGAIADPGGSTMENFGFDSDWRGFDVDDASNWADDIADTSELLQKSRNRNLWDSVRSGDLLKREASTGFMGIGGRPDGTRLSNKINADDERPLWDMYAFFTPDDYNYAESQGQDTSNQRGLDAVGQTVGKAFINNFTGGLGSTALDAMNSWGYGDDENAQDLAKRAGRNYLLSQVGGNYAGGLANIADAADGGDRRDIWKAVGQMAGGAALRNSGAGMDYLNGLFDEDMPDVGTIGGTMAENGGETSSTMGGTIGPNQVAADSQRQYAMSAPQQSSPVSAFIQALTAGSGTQQGSLGGNLADFGSSLYGMYNANKQRRAYKDQLGQLQQLFSPGSPYAQMARQRMERKDAAAGRRSQYGARETQLAALLADRQAQTFPQQAQYQSAIGGLDNQMVNAGFRGLNQGRNLYPQLMNLFNQGGN